MDAWGNRVEELWRKPTREGYEQEGCPRSRGQTLLVMRWLGGGSWLELGQGELIRDVIEDGLHWKADLDIFVAAVNQAGKESWSLVQLYDGGVVGDVLSPLRTVHVVEDDEGIDMAAAAAQDPFVIRRETLRTGWRGREPALLAVGTLLDAQLVASGCVPVGFAVDVRHGQGSLVLRHLRLSCWGRVDLF